MKSIKTVNTNSIEGEKAPAEDLGFSQSDLDTIMLSELADFRHRLWSAEIQLAPLPVEVAFLFSVDGVELGRAIGTATQVRLTEEQRELVRGGILTHNHPDGSFFSWEDIYLAHELNLTEIRAVQQSNPIQVLSMSRPTGGWVSAADFKVLKEREETENAARVMRLNKMTREPLLPDSEELTELIDKQWPAYFQARLPYLSYPYKSILLQEPPQ